MKNQSIILLEILILAQLAVPVAMIHSKEKILRNGELLRFKTRPIDPADPFQGRYVRLGFEEDHIPWPEDRESEILHKEPIYALLETDAQGFARFTGWSKERPASGMFLKTRYLGNRTEWDRESQTSRYKGLRVDLPFDRYYMDEAKAPRAERLVRDAVRTTNCWADVRILGGKAVIEDVFAEGQSLRVLAAEKE